MKEFNIAVMQEKIVAANNVKLRVFDKGAICISQVSL
jgi:hypothetical protein